MICPACQQNDWILKPAHLTIEKEGKTLHVNNAPVRICRRCGERYVEEEVLAEISQAIGIVFAEDLHIDIDEG